MKKKKIEKLRLPQKMEYQKLIDEQIALGRKLNMYLNKRK